jgi:ATP-dependent DNA helicase DinG
MQDHTLNDLKESPALAPSHTEPQTVGLVEDVCRFFHDQLSNVEAFQKRDAQLQMALAIAKTIETGGQIAVEAGTGTGKSLAYLVPLLLRESPDDAPCIIATKTVQLQQQLLEKDLPILQRLLPVPRKVVRAKGWANYVCIRKVETPDEPSLRELGPMLPQLRQRLLQNSGRLTRQETSLHQRAWNRVKADPLDCQKRHCPHFGSCGLFAERRELESAEIVVTNHAFLLTDLRLRREGGGLLPVGDVLVVDEAHRLDDVATEHLAIRFDPDRIFSCISSPLLSGADGWLAAARFTFLMTLPEIDFQSWSARFDQIVLLSLKNLEILACDIFVELQGILFQQGQSRLPLASLLHSDLGERLANLGSELCLGLEEVANAMAQLCRDYEEAFHVAAPPELLRLSQGLARLGYDLQFLLECDSDDWVYLLEAEPQSLVARPVDNAAALQTELFGEYSAVITTSASLQVSDSFQFFKKRTGLTSNVAEFSFPSPFNIAQNTFIGLTDRGPEPSSPDYPLHLLEPLTELANGLQGRTLLLTTSHRRVREFTELLVDPLGALGIEVLSQGTESAAQLLRRFTSPGHHFLIGVDTFWEGVDIPGERLSCVVMTRLPFPVPSDALFQARARKIESAGGQAFEDLSMPLVGLKMKQGFGRLLRAENDKGLFLLTDPRASTKRYGRQLLRNLPCRHAQRNGTAEIVRQALRWSDENLDFLGPHEMLPF